MPMLFAAFATDDVPSATATATAAEAIVIFCMDLSPLLCPFHRTLDGLLGRVTVI